MPEFASLILLKLSFDFKYCWIFIEFKSPHQSSWKLVKIYATMSAEESQISKRSGNCAITFKLKKQIT